MLWAQTFLARRLVAGACMRCSRSLGLARLLATEFVLPQRLARCKSACRFQMSMRQCIMSIVEEGDRQPGNPTVLRVGAHLAWGDPNDPFPYTALRNARRVRSVLVEPEPVAHEQLRLLIATSNLSNVAAVNAAVCASDARGGKVTFYSRRGGVENSSLPQFASLNKQHVLDHLKRGGHRWRPSAHLQELEVACASVATTLDRLGVATEDLLLMTVDAEGSDLDIVRAAPWGRDFLPRLLLFEHRHIVRQPGGLEQTRAFLSALRANHSYRCEDTLDEENVYCVHERAAPLAGKLLAPSAVWISIASVLTWTIWSINEPREPLLPKQDGSSAPLQVPLIAADCR